jgi:hypothetical protein
VFAFVKNRTTALVVSSAPRNISVISRSGGNRNCSEFYDYFNLKISRSLVLDYCHISYLNYI